MSKKEQVVALISPEVKARLEALRIVMHVSRARVMEAGWESGGLAALEAVREHATGLRKLRALARHAGVTIEDYATAYAKAYSTKTYGPTVEELTADDTVLRGWLGTLPR